GTLLGEAFGVRALEESAEAIVAKRRLKGAWSEGPKNQRAELKKKLANERPNRHARRADAITAITIHPTKKGPVVQPPQPDRGHAKLSRRVPTTESELRGSTAGC